MTSLIIVLFLGLSSAITYNEDIAKELAALAFGAYCPAEAIQNWETGYVSENYPDLERIQVVDNDEFGTRAYLAYNSKRDAITVVFRGTDNPRNWIEDITLTKIKFNDLCNCQVHQGFFTAYTSLKLLVDPLLPEYKLRYPGASLQVAGHSLGGAMATMFASEISALGFKVFLVTLGSPRLGDSAFYDWLLTLRVTHYRIVHERDYAPHLPFKAVGYQHVLSEIWYNNGVPTICQEVKGEDPSCSASVKNPVYNDHLEYLGWSFNVDC